MKIFLFIYLYQFLYHGIISDSAEFTGSFLLRPANNSSLTHVRLPPIRDQHSDCQPIRAEIRRGDRKQDDHRLEMCWGWVESTRSFHANLFTKTFTSKTLLASWDREHYQLKWFHYTAETTDQGRDEFWGFSRSDEEDCQDLVWEGKSWGKFY